MIKNNNLEKNNLFSIKSISPIDGRYSNQLYSLKNIFSEYALIKLRIEIEIKWLQTLSSIKKIPEIHHFSNLENHFLNNIIINFNEQDAIYIKKIEYKINHDVKSIEYFLKKKISCFSSLKKVSEFIHFACTSEDINNLAYALIMKNTRKNVILPYWKKIIFIINQLSLQYKLIPMVSRTHGQIASPSTLGKEFANIAFRLKRQLLQLKKIKVLGKYNGAVGNYNAHYMAYPKINWHEISKNFVCSFGINWNPYTTQIEPHDYIVEFLHCITRFNNILIDFNRDLWGYISLNYFLQKKTSNIEIGSSTMPHKINPIDFENSEGNLGMSNAIFNYMSNKLPISRWQRDLTDSTILRNIGSSISYSVIAYNSIIKGIKKLKVNKMILSKDLDYNWSILAEPIQTIMRRYGIKNAYEKLKKLTHGKLIRKKEIKKFINSLNIPEKEKKRLKSTKPSTYIGHAVKLVEEQYKK